LLFNGDVARVLYTNDFNSGWQSLNDHVEIPVTKRVVGQEIFLHPGNQLTESYKEEYVLSDEILSILPEGTADVVVNQSPDNLHWTLLNSNINTEFRVLRSVNATVKSTDIMTTGRNLTTGINVLAIARFDHVLISLDYGSTFERVLYPVNEGFLQIASVSKDGLYFFFVAKDGVYRYAIGDKDWVVIRLIDVDNGQLSLEGFGVNNRCYFANDEIFCFTLHDDINTSPIADIYWKGPNLKNAKFAENTLGRIRLTNIIHPNTKLTKSYRDSNSMYISTRIEDDTHITSLVAWLPGQSTSTSRFVSMIGMKNANLVLYHTELNKTYGSIDNMRVTLTHPTGLDISFSGVEVMCSTVYDNKWYNTKMIVGESNIIHPYLTFEYLQLIADGVNDFGAPVNLNSGYVDDDYGTKPWLWSGLIDKMTHTVDGVASWPLELENSNRIYTISIDNCFYTMIDDVIYTNKLSINNSAVLTYTRLVIGKYTKVPNVSYSGSELYLGFDNELKITANHKIKGKLYFNLPSINNHMFTSNINGLLNISTTEIAAFLISKVYIITQAPDELFGFRYEYKPTRLSIGIRLGDSVINTINGVLTLYPTIQGLAVMNYQADVANTDQVVEYVTNNITSIWTEFYKNGAIKMIQMKDYIYLSNGTNTYLMLDLRGMTWWVLTSPLPVHKIVTNQIDFNIVSNGLYKYDSECTVYEDLKSRHISWQLESQPHHFNAPTHYKNLRQIIFLLEESNDIEQTMLSQIKLYRKQFTLREPEVIGFKINSYRTFIKRFNYWKINELQWALASDSDNANPSQLRLNGLTIKYEISEEVRS